MKKIFLPIILFCLLTIIFAPLVARAAEGLVQCQGPSDCDLTAFGKMLEGIYKLIIQVATPLGILAVTIGGILIMVSAGNPNLMGIGKKVFWSGIIGLFLVFASKAIINFILSAIGASQV